MNREDLDMWLGKLKLYAVLHPDFDIRNSHCELCPYAADIGRVLERDEIIDMNCPMNCLMYGKDYNNGEMSIGECLNGLSPGECIGTCIEWIKHV